MTPAKTVAVDAQELRQAFDFVSIGGSMGFSAWICLDTGRIYSRSSETGLEDEDIPEDIDESDRYLAVPTQHDLGLGRRLALDFAAEELADDYHTVAGYFRRRGAYGRFKALLEARGLLATWYEYESRAAEAALQDWCEANDIQMVPANP